MQTDASSSSSSASPPPPPTRSDDKSGATVDTAETEAAAAATRKAANLARLAAAMRVNEVRLRATPSEPGFWPTGDPCAFEVHAVDHVCGVAAELAADGIDIAKRLVCLVLDEKTVSAHYVCV